MTKPVSYRPLYASSRALVIGIDKYKQASPLYCARNDAQGVSTALVEHLKFPKENVTLLLDEKATGKAIRTAYLDYAVNEEANPDDRLFVFFAGHGFTFASGRRGEAGFLVPVDGDVRDLSTLIRWDDLVRSADLIPAKHILFLIDACYGGLAISRRPLPPGSTRFLRNMLQRYARQVLTSGKADEVVADAGGVRAGHSIFTAHVLDALEGAAATSEGVLTANRLMAYVYEKVANDQNSHQTPHYGFLDGDGDFVFDMAPLENLGHEETGGEDLLVNVGTTSPVTVVITESIGESLKRLISDPRDQIRLDDFVSAQIRRVIPLLDLKNFPASEAITSESIARRLKKYEEATADLQTIVILLARWSTPNQLPLLEKILTRIAEADKGGSGITVWLDLAWYPLQLLMYAAGISAVSAQNFDALRIIFMTRVKERNRPSAMPNVPLVVRVAEAMTEIVQVFKMLPGHEREYVPCSEYLFALLQPPIEDLLFLGQSYEACFDEYEIMTALVFADISAGSPPVNVWGPPGRFAWKHRRGGDSAPFDHVVKSAAEHGQNWPPIEAGLFNKSSQRFSDIAKGYRALIPQFNFR